MGKRKISAVAVRENVREPLKLGLISGYSRKRHVETSRREEEMGRVKVKERGGGGEREEKTPALKNCENEKHPLIRRA